MGWHTEEAANRNPTSIEKNRQVESLQSQNTREVKKTGTSLAIDPNPRPTRTNKKTDSRKKFRRYAA